MFDKFEQSNETPSYVPQTSKLKKWTRSGLKTLDVVYNVKRIRLEELYIACDGDVIPCCHWGNVTLHLNMIQTIMDIKKNMYKF